MDYTTPAFEPQNGPAEETHPKAHEKLTRMIVDEVNRVAGEIRSECKGVVDEKVSALGQEIGVDVANRVNKLAWANDPEKHKALMSLLGLEDCLRIMATSDFENESMPKHLRTLNERVGGLEVLIQEADSRRKPVEDSLDPRAEAIEENKARLMTDGRLRASYSIDPRLTLEYTDMMNRYIRKGHENLTTPQRAMWGRAWDFQERLLDDHKYQGPWDENVQNALAPDFAPGAGLLVPPTMDTRIRKKLTEFSPVVGLANRVPCGTDRYMWLQEKGDLPTSTVVGPHGTGGTASTNEELWQQRATDIFILEVYTPLIRAQVEDASQDLVALLTDMAARQMGKDLSTWVITGDGAGQPWGITQDSGVTSVNSGVADEIKLSSLLFLMTQLPGFYASNASYVLGDDAYTAAVIELDGDGRPKWNPSTSSGVPPTLFGHAVARDTYFTAATSKTIAKVTFAASAKVAAFADWARFAIMPERHGTRFVRSEVATTPQQIDIAFFQRTGFAVDLAEAGRVLTVSA